MLVYRIAHKNYTESLSPSGTDGRWVSAGKLVVYCAESIPLAFLESMVRRQGVGFNSDFKIVFVEIPDHLSIETIDTATMDEGWRDIRDNTICQQHGNKWYDANEKPVLKVPSVILPSSYNYVLNTKHKDFAAIKIVRITDLVPDERIEEILKKYRKS